MRNLYAEFLHIYKQLENLVNKHSNIPRPRVIPRFSGLKVIFLAL